MSRRRESLRLIAGLSALLSLAGTRVLAQSGKPIIAVMPFSAAIHTVQTAQVAGVLKGSILGALHDLNVYTVVDRGEMQRVAGEQQTQQQVIDSRSIVEQGRILGARYITYGSIDQVSTKSEEGSDRSRVYQGDVTATLNVLDVTTGEVVATHQFHATSGARVFGVIVGRSESPDDALNDAARRISAGFKDFYRGAVPVEYAVAQVNDLTADSSGGTLLIAGGTTSGVTVGQQFRIVERTQVTVGDHTLTHSVDIGRATISSVDDENFSEGNMSASAGRVAHILAAKGVVVALPVAP